MEQYKNLRVAVQPGEKAGSQGKEQSRSSPASDASQAASRSGATVSTSGRSSSGRSSGSHSPHNFPCSKLKLDQFFLHWLSMPENQKLVVSVLEDAQAGRPLKWPSSSTSAPLSPGPLVSGVLTPPLSPSKAKAPQSPRVQRRRAESGPQSGQNGKFEIPRFFFPDGPPVEPEVVGNAKKEVQLAFAEHPEGLTAQQLTHVVREVLKLPGILAYPLFQKLVSEGQKEVSLATFMQWFNTNQVMQADRVKRMYLTLKQPGQEYLCYDDFKPLVAALVATHPGLEFLQDTPEFQDRYGETVTYRIFYGFDRLGDGRLRLGELRRGDLLEVLEHLEKEDDINSITKYFSYEHFYVIYCRFWELDKDHDFLLSREDLLRYGNHSLTYKIVDRIFDQVPRRFTSGVADRMGFEDFVWFILSEEDKTTDLALSYWFRCADLDGDGLIRPFEMMYFYEEQLQRMECLAHEAVLFEDVWVQLVDMLRPADPGAISLRDLKKSKALSGILFNIMFNLQKFLAFEMRDPFQVRQERLDDPEATDWDRFAKQEYLRMAMEEENAAAGQDMQVEEDSRGMWEDSMVV